MTLLKNLAHNISIFFNKYYIFKITIYYAFIVVSSVIIIKYKYSSALSAILVFYIFARALSISRFLLLTVLMPLFFISTLAMIFKVIYSTEVGIIIKSIFSYFINTPKVNFTFNDFLVILAVGLYTIFTFKDILLKKVVIDHFRFSKKQAVNMVLLTLGIYLCYPSIPKIYKSTFFNTGYVYANVGLEAVFSGIKYSFFKYEAKPLESYPLTYKKNDIIFVFHLGESLRGDHLGINGYEYQTTPYLNKQDIINFGIIKSFSNHTLDFLVRFINGLNSKTNINTRIKGINFNYIISPYIKTYVTWPKLQNLYDVPYHVNEKNLSTRSILGIFVKKGTIYNIIKPYDYDLDKALENNLKREDFKQPIFMLLRNNGSHSKKGQTYLNYSEMFKDNNTSENERVNGYNKTVFYTDFLINQEIEALKKIRKNVIFLYTSDHGESLGENGFFLHGNKSIENKMVPLLFWVSDEYKKNFKKEYKNLLSNSKKYQNQIDSEVLWHTLLDAFGFENQDLSNPIIDKEKSLISESLKPSQNKNWFEKGYKRL